ncbi:MAG: hypothetical protein P1V81_09645 [Planctomycetota bacterium]|nr:hypothetical protein [Planctomycetota bacterium]
MLLASLPDFAALDWSALVWTDVVARLHPVLLHLPIGLLTLLFATEVWGIVRRKKGERDGTRGLLVLLLFLTAPVVALSGWFLHTEGYVGIEWHRNLGIAVAVLSVLIALTYWGKTRAYGALVFLGFATMVAASHLGATITHGEDFLFEPWHAAVKADAPAPAAQPDADGGVGGASEASGASPVDAPAAGQAAEQLPVQGPGQAAGSSADGTTGKGTPVTTGATDTEALASGLEAAGSSLASAAEGSADTSSPTVPGLTPTQLPSLHPTWSDVGPVLADLCTNCHGPRKQKGGLALHTLERALAGGEDGPVLTPGDWRSSPLLLAIALPLEHDDHMPPEGKRQPSPEQLALIQAWVAALADEVPTTEGTPEAPAPVPATPGGQGDQGQGAQPATQPPTAGQADTGSADSTTRASASAEDLLAARAAWSQQVAAHADEPFEAFASRLASRQIGVAPLGPASADPAPPVRLNLTAFAPSAGGLVEVLTGGPRQLREVVLFGQALTFEDLFVLRQAAAEVGGLETLELRNLGGPPLDLGPLAALASKPTTQAGAFQPDATHHLRHLNLAGTRLAPGAVAHLAALPQLESVHLWGTGLTEADLAELAALRPGLAITGASEPLAEPLETEPEVVFTKATDTTTDATTNATIDAPVLVAENTTCPVSGTPVDPRYTVAFEGRLIGFCCTNCPKTFWDDPEAFLAKLDAE